MKALFLVPYPTEGASNRIRVEQYIPYLKSQGIHCRVRSFLNRRFFEILYRPHHIIEKIFWLLICTANRIFDIVRALKYDIIFIHRETYPLGGPIIELILHKMKKPIVFDFDDSIFLPSTSEHNTYIERFKRPDKISKIIRLSRKVIAGNDYLEGYALKYNRNVIVIPSSVDTEKYCPDTTRQDKEKLIIGWIGSNTTKNFLYDIEDALVELSARYNNIEIEIVGADFYSPKLKNVVNRAWSLEDEVRVIRGFDIGIMPMPDNVWTRGKCGFKALLYMSVGISVVCSPVGVNNQIIEDGVTGFFAKDKTEWIERLSVLINDKALREKIGASARRKVEERYSVKNNASKLIAAVREASDA